MFHNYPLRVVRGGSWGGIYDSNTPYGLRSAKRFAFVEWTRSFQIGFRCVKDILDENQN
jgi:formylglycine-generating enzyme required for sulfatase activity